MKLTYRKMRLFPMTSCSLLHEAPDVSLVDPAGSPLGLVSPDTQWCPREAWEEEVLFSAVVVHIA